MNNNPSKRYLVLVALLLLVGFYIRAHNIMILPPFNDESLHIRRAEQVWHFSDPNLSFTPGKVLTYYWYGLFNADRLNGVFVDRTATALFSLLGLAGTFAVGKRLFGLWGGVLALYLLTFAPFMIFFDRMALTDPTTAALGMLLLWASLLLVKNPDKLRYGFLCGVLGTLTILAKLIGTPFTLMPLVAIWLFSPEKTLRQKWERYQATVIICYSTILAVMTPLFLRVLYKELSGNRISVVDDHLINTKSPLETIADNLVDLWEAVHVFNGLPLVILLVLLLPFALRSRPKALSYALISLALPWGALMIVSGVLSTRYLQIGVPMFYLSVAGILVIGTNDLLKRLRKTPSNYEWVITWSIASLWIVLLAYPFILSAWHNPLELRMTERGRWEYFQNFTAGYGLMEAADYLETLTPSEEKERVQVVGIVGSCHQIRLYLDENGIVDLVCTEFGWSGEFMGEVAEYVSQRATEDEPLYLLVEPQLPYTDLSQLTISHERLARFPRPFDGMTVEVWQVQNE